MVKSEIKRNNAQNRILRSRVKELEQGIKEYLQSKNQSGLKYNGRAIILQNKERRPTKKKQNKETDVVLLLQNLGITDARNVYKRIIEAQKGDPVNEQHLTFKKIS